MTVSKLQARRDALKDKQFTILFYGGWYVIDQKKTRGYIAATPFRTIEQALNKAETKNAEAETHPE